MKWREIGRVKFQAGAVFGFTTGRSRPRYETVVIWMADVRAEALGLKPVLKCGCTSTKTYHYDAEKLEEPRDACRHISALYGNGTAVIMRDDVTGEALGRHPFGKVRLTELGHQLFDWRHVAMALE